MATIAEMAVRIGADISGFEKSMGDATREVNTFGTEIKNSTSNITSSLSGVSDETRTMAQNMQEAYSQQRASLAGFKAEQMAVKYQFFELAKGAKTYAGTTNEFMGEILKAGKAQKTVTENMMKNNDMLKTNFYTTVGTMLARSTQSEKIAQNFERMNNPLYKVNSGLLKVTQGLEGIAKQGQPAVMALKMLGPTANMKELNDMTRLITAGLMRFQMVALIAGVAAVAFYANLNSAAIEAVPAYKEATEQLSKATEGIFKPMAELFGVIMTPIVEFIAQIFEMIQAFNKAHPVLAKIIQGFLMLIPALTFILAPLAIGIGYFGGLQAALASVWMLIGPVVIGFASMMGTVLLVAAVITVLATALWALWTKTDWFKTAVITAWEGIKTATIKIWNFIYENGVKPAIDAIVAFGQSTLGKFAGFWQQNGDTIKTIVSVAWSAIKTVFTVHLAWLTAAFLVAFTAVKTAVSVAFQAIKLIINVVVNTVLGIFTAFFALLRGDWKGALEAVQGIVKNNFDDVISFIKGLGKTFLDAGKGLIEMMAKGIKQAAGKVIDNVKDVAEKVRDFLPFSPAKEGPLSDLDKLDFGGPIADSIDKAVPTVKGLMSNLLSMPDVNVSHGSNAVSKGNTVENKPVTINVTIPAGDVKEFTSVVDFFNRLPQVARAW
jgi:phage-related protein